MEGSTYICMCVGSALSNCLCSVCVCWPNCLCVFVGRTTVPVCVFVGGVIHLPAFLLDPGDSPCVPRADAYFSGVYGVGVGVREPTEKRGFYYVRRGSRRA